MTKMIERKVASNKARKLTKEEKLKQKQKKEALLKKQQRRLDTERRKRDNELSEVKKAYLRSDLLTALGIGKNQAFHCDTEEKASSLLDFFANCGIYWIEDTTDTHFEKYKEDTCYSLDYAGEEYGNYKVCVWFSDLEYYKKEEKAQIVEVDDKFLATLKERKADYEANGVQYQTVVNVK